MSRIFPHKPQLRALPVSFKNSSADSCILAIIIWVFLMNPEMNLSMDHVDSRSAKSIVYIVWFWFPTDPIQHVQPELILWQKSECDWLQNIVAIFIMLTLCVLNRLHVCLFEIAGPGSRLPSHVLKPLGCLSCVCLGVPTWHMCVCVSACIHTC